MDLRSLLGANQAHGLDQLQSSLEEWGKVLRLHHMEMVARGFSELQAWQLTQQLHRGWVEKVMR